MAPTVPCFSRQYEIQTPGISGAHLHPPFRKVRDHHLRTWRHGAQAAKLPMHLMTLHQGVDRLHADLRQSFEKVGLLGTERFSEPPSPRLYKREQRRSGQK
jgi:hypothetical protein